jgi:hypothetical protein
MRRTSLAAAAPAFAWCGLPTHAASEHRVEVVMARPQAGPDFDARCGA